MDVGDSQFQPLVLSDTLSFDGLGTPLQAPLASPQEYVLLILALRLL